jgi:hypothetical protein
MQIHFNIWPGDATFGGNLNAAILPVREYINWVQYSSFDNGTFTLAWREDFTNGTLPSDWTVGTFPSPKNLSIHSPANVTFVGGIAELSLTADNATGFTGTPPADGDGGLPPVLVDASSESSTPSRNDAAVDRTSPGSNDGANGTPAGNDDGEKDGGPPVSADASGVSTLPDASDAASGTPSAKDAGASATPPKADAGGVSTGAGGSPHAGNEGGASPAGGAAAGNGSADGCSFGLRGNSRPMDVFVLTAAVAAFIHSRRRRGARK